MSALILMFLSVLMFSIYPLLAAQGVETTDPLLFLLIAHTAAAGFALFYGKALFDKKYGRLKKPRPLFQLTPRLWGTVALTGISSAINHICFIFALMLTSKIGATMIYETWPILALWLAPVLVPKGENGVRLADYVFGLLAVLGGAFVIASINPDSRAFFTADFWQNLDPQKTFGYALAVAGSIGVAVSTVLRRRVTQHLRAQHDDHLLMASCLSTGITRLAALPVFIIGFLILQRPESAVTGIGANGFALALVTGIGVHVLGSVFYVFSMMRNPDPVIPVPDFLAPILSVSLLALFGFDHFTALSVIGGLCIISATLLVTVRAEDGFAYTASILTLLLGGIYCYFTAGQEMSNFYDAISVSAVFYAILIAFAWDRVLERSKHEEALILDIVYGMEALKPDKKTAALQTQVQTILSTDDKAVIGRAYREICALRDKMKLPTEKNALFHDIDSLILSKTKDIMLSEIVLLCLIGGVTFFGILTHRPPGLWPDMMAFIMAGAIVFIFFAIFDQLKTRKNSLIKLDSSSVCKFQESYFDSRSEFKIVTIILIAIMLTVFYALFLMKYNSLS